MSDHKLVTIGLPATGYVRMSQLIPQILPFSPATLWRKIRTNDFPQPYKLGKRISAWRVEDIREWLNAQTHEYKGGARVKTLIADPGN